MEEKRELSLNDKIQKLINNYKVLKQKYNIQAVEKGNLSEKCSQLEEAHGKAMVQIDSLKHATDEHEEEIEMLMEENNKLTEQINSYETKTQSALLQLDDVLGQLTDL